MKKQKERRLLRAVKARRHVYKENKEMLIGIMR